MDAVVLKQALSVAAWFAVAVVVSFTGTTQSALGGTYPDHTVRIIVPYPAGNTVDVAARTIVPKLAEALGQALYIDNRGGANGTIGAEVAARAKPDGYTLLYTSQSIATNPALYPNLPFDALKDFAPIALLTIHGQVLVVNNDLPVKSVPELVNYAKAHPGTLNFASTGIGTTGHLAGAYFANLAGIEMQHVPYTGAGPASIDLADGRVQLMFYSYQPLLPMIQTGKLRVLATTGEKRDPSLPDMPTVMESGYPEFKAFSWEGLYAPAGTPKDVIDRIHSALVKVLADPDVLAAIRQNNGQPALDTPDEFKEFTRSEIDRGRKMIEISGATAN